MRLATTFTLLTICLTAIGQNFPTKKDSWSRADSSYTRKDRRKILTDYSYVNIDTEFRHTDSTGIAVIIQNSLPKGAGYVDAVGKNVGGRIFWTRVINETAAPLELTINFPADSFAMVSPSDSYFKVFLPPDTMTLDKEGLYAYGSTGLKSYVDTGISRTTMLQRTINPQEACMFYIGVHFLGERQGFARAGLVLKDQKLFYENNLLSSLIPCGQLVFKK